MRLKLYRGSRMTEAMAAVRAELGDDAFILSSKRVAGGFEVTAALPRPAPAADLVQRSAREGALRFHGVPEPLIGQLLEGAFAEALGAVFAFSAMALERTTRPLLVMGPAGAGKTLTVARLAARLVMAGIRPMVISADCHKAGANEQLAALLEVLRLDLTVCEPLDLAKLLARPRPSGPVLIDLAGSNPFDADERLGLARLCDPALVCGALVLPAGLAAEEARDLAACYQSLGCETLVSTRLDAARRLGGVLTAASTGLRLSEAGVRASVMEGLAPMTPAFLAARLLDLPIDRKPDDVVA